MLTLPGIGDAEDAPQLDAFRLVDEFGAVDDLLARTEGQVEAYLVTPVTPIPLTQRVESPLPGPVGARHVATRKMGLLDYLAGAVEAVTRTLLSALDPSTTAAAR